MTSIFASQEVLTELKSFCIFSFSNLVDYRKKVNRQFLNHSESNRCLFIFQEKRALERRLSELEEELKVRINYIMSFSKRISLREPFQRK